jgi:hypothetical protein
MILMIKMDKKINTGDFINVSIRKVRDLCELDSKHAI